MKVFTVFGTRPEAIKMCPLIIKLKENNNIDCIVCLTGQHKEMLQQVMDAFNVKEDYNLEIMKERQTLTTITTSILEKILLLKQIFLCRNIEKRPQSLNILHFQKF